MASLLFLPAQVFAQASATEDPPYVFNYASEGGYYTGPANVFSEIFGSAPIDICLADEKEAYTQDYMKIRQELFVLDKASEEGICRLDPAEVLYTDAIQGSEAVPLSVSIESSSYLMNPLAMMFIEQNTKLFSQLIKERFATWLSRSGRYMNMMKNILREEGIPEDIAYLPFVESGFNNLAYSRSKASGPWQFIAPTGKRYGLKINKWVDERRDPVKSTRAAAKYLKDLYKMFGSWSLALAGYNAGENKVKKALQMTGSDDFWSLVSTKHLKSETKHYVPRFIAARHIAVNPYEYGFNDVKYQPDFSYDEVTIDTALSLDAIAKCTGSSVSEIKELNPELKRSITPPNVQSYALRIPHGTRDKFLDSLSTLSQEKMLTEREYTVKSGDTVWGISRKTGVPSNVIISYNKLGAKARLRKGQTLLIPSTSAYASYDDSQDEPEVQYKPISGKSYTVKKGDSPYTIAKRAGIKVDDFLKANSLRKGSLIKPGQKLVIPARSRKSKVS